MESGQFPDQNQEEGQVHLQAELPTVGTPLNPIEEAWAFDQNAGAAPVDQLASSMQQGE